MDAVSRHRAVLPDDPIAPLLDAQQALRLPHVLVAAAGQVDDQDALLARGLRLLRQHERVSERVGGFEGAYDALGTGEQRERVERGLVGQAVALDCMAGMALSEGEGLTAWCRSRSCRRDRSSPTRTLP